MGHYLAVGDGYVEGAMDGELWRSKLPNALRAIYLH